MAYGLGVTVGVVVAVGLDVSVGVRVRGAVGVDVDEGVGDGEGDAGGVSVTVYANLVASGSRLSVSGEFPIQAARIEHNASAINTRLLTNFIC